MANKYWLLTTGGAWSTASNWSDTGPTGAPSSSAPQAGDNVFIQQNTTTNGTLITLPATIPAVASITLQDTDTASGYWTFGDNNTNTLTVNGTLDFSSPNSNYWRLKLAGNGTVNLRGATVSTFYTPLFDSTFTGTLNVIDGGFGASGANTSNSWMNGGTVNIGHPTIAPTNGIGFDNGSATALTYSQNKNLYQNFTFLGPSARTVNFTGNMTLKKTIEVTVSAGTGTLGGVIDDGGNNFGLSLRNTGGTFNFNGINTYTGDTKFLAGTVALSGQAAQNSSIAWDTTNGTVTVASSTILGGLYSINNSTAAFSATANPFTVGNANKNETFDGALSGVGGITKSGTGTWTLTSNATTRTGATTVTGGELVLKASNAIGNTTTGAVTIGLLGTMTLDGTGLTFPGKATSLLGTLRSINGGVAENNYNGQITSNSTSAKIENATIGTTLRLNGNIGVGTQALTFTGSGNINVGVLGTSASGVVNWTGAGTLSVGTSWGTYFNGTFNAQSGTIVASSSFGNSGTINVNGANIKTTELLTFNNGIVGTSGVFELTGSVSRAVYLSTGRISEWGGYFTESGTGQLSIQLLSTASLILRGNTNSTHSGTTTIAFGTLDSAHGMPNSAVSFAAAGTIGAGGWNGTSGGLGNFSIPSLSFSTISSSNTVVFRSSKKDASTLPSKLVIAGFLTRSPALFSVIGAGTGWVSGTEYLVASFASTTGTGTISAGTWADSVNTRIGNGTVRTTATAIYLTPAAANTTVTWAGGTSGGQWFNNQPSGWSGSSAPAFANGDTVVFNTSSTVTATLTENVTVNGITMNAANHAISGGFTLTNTSGLTIGGVFTQTLDAPMTHAGNITIGLGSELLVSNASALTQSTGIVDMTAGTAKLTTLVNVTVSRQVSLPTTSGANTTFQKTGGTTLTLSGAVVDGANATNVNIVGSGVLHMNVGLPTNAVLRVVDNATTNGSNVFRTTNALNESSALVLGFAGIYETNRTTFSRAYGTSAGQVTCLNTGGGGFSSFSGSGLTVSTALTYGSSVVSQWSGPMYFGTALATSQSKTTLSGAQNINGQTQTFHVFNGANANGSTGEISGKISGSGTITKAGPGTLIISNATNDFTASVAVSTGKLVTTNATALNTQSVMLAASTTLQAQTGSGTALNVNNLTTGTGSRIIIGA